jgi:hypothetical protein
VILSDNAIKLIPNIAVGIARHNNLLGFGHAVLIIKLIYFTDVFIRLYRTTKLNCSNLNDGEVVPISGFQLPIQ